MKPTNNTPLPYPVRLAGFIRESNPNHHLFNNNGTWWIQATVHYGPCSERIRRSLKTRDIEEARRKRDRFLERLAALSDQTQAA